MAANSGTSVLPISTTSGGSFWASAVLSLVLMFAHSCTWRFTLAPVAAVNAAFIAPWSWVLRSPSMYQTVRVPPCGTEAEAAAGADEPPQAEAPKARARTPAHTGRTRKRVRWCTGILLGGWRRPRRTRGTAAVGRKDDT